MPPTRKQSGETPEPIRLHVAVGAAQSQIQDRITKGRELDSDLDGCASRDTFKDISDRFYQWDAYNRTLLSRLFRGPIVREYEWSLPISTLGGSSLAEDVQDRKNDLRGAVRHLISILDRLPLWSEDDVAPSRSNAKEDSGSKRFGDRVFVVHGHDEAPKHEVARFLDRLGVAPLILSEQPSLGMTLVEKLEHYASQVGFAVVILSPDDVGGLASAPSKLAERPRQNVVFEMGYFIGVLKRARVCAILAGNLERPSDIDGVVYVRLSGNWKIELANELRAAGFSVDMNSISG